MAFEYYVFETNTFIHTYIGQTGNGHCDQTVGARAPFCSVLVLYPLGLVSKYITNIGTYITEHRFIHRYWNYLWMHFGIVGLRCFMFLWFTYSLDDPLIFMVLTCIRLLRTFE